MAVELTELHKYVRIELPGILEPVLADATLKVVQEFFKESEAWRHTVPTLLDWTMAQTFPTLTQGVELPANTRLARVDEVKYASDGSNLKPIAFRTRQQLDNEFPDWEVRTGSSPQRWTNEAMGDAPRLIPIATADVLGSLQVRAIVVPDANLTELPDFLFYEYEDDFRNGILARLMKIPGKDWTNISAASSYLQMFRTGKMKAKSRAKAEYGQPDRTMSYGGIGGSVDVGSTDYGQ